MIGIFRRSTGIALQSTLHSSAVRPRPASALSHAIGHAAMGQFSRLHLDHLSPYFPAVPGDPAVLPVNATTLQEFITELKPVLDVQQLPSRAFEWIFHPEQLLTKPHPNCGGTDCAPTKLTALLAGLPFCKGLACFPINTGCMLHVAEAASLQVHGWSLVCLRELQSTEQRTTGRISVNRIRRRSMDLTRSRVCRKHGEPI